MNAMFYFAGSLGRNVQRKLFQAKLKVKYYDKMSNTKTKATDTTGNKQNKKTLNECIKHNKQQIVVEY